MMQRSLPLSNCQLSFAGAKRERMLQSVSVRTMWSMKVRSTIALLPTKAIPNPSARKMLLALVIANRSRG